MHLKCLVISSRARKANAAIGALLPGVSLIKYRLVFNKYFKNSHRKNKIIKNYALCTILCSYESTSLEDLYQLILEEVQHQKAKVENLAFLLSGSEKA